MQCYNKTDMSSTKLAYIFENLSQREKSLMSWDDSQRTCFLNQSFRAIFRRLLVLLSPKTESSKQHLEAAIDYVHESEEWKSIIYCQMNQQHMSLRSPIPTLIFLILKLIIFFGVHFCITLMIFSTLSEE